MPLTPGAAAALEMIAAASKPLNELTVDEARAGLRTLADALSLDPEPVASVEDRIIESDTLATTVRIYRTAPLSGEARSPVILMIHGGGWALGDLESHDRFARSLCNASGAIVVAVDYRRSPEHRFPAALDDSYAALCWISDNATALGADPEHLVVAGDSAGGNLTAAIALLVRERGGPPIAGQILIYPALDAGCNTQSFVDLRDGYFLTLEKTQWYWQMYLPDGDDGSDPLACPLRAVDLSRLPPALVVTAEFDPLRDEGEAFAAALVEAGVPAKVKRYDGLIHAFALMSKLIPEAQEVVAECAAFVRLVASRSVAPPL